MSTPNASGWKPGTPVTGHNAMSGPDTATGNRALMLEEPLLFEIGHVETTGVDLPEPQGGANRLGGTGLRRSACPACPSPKPCVTTRACRGRTTRSTSACSRSVRAL